MRAELLWSVRSVYVVVDARSRIVNQVVVWTCLVRTLKYRIMIEVCNVRVFHA